MDIEKRIKKKEGRPIYNLKGPEAPFLISFPRSGRHWYTLSLPNALGGGEDGRSIAYLGGT